MRPVSRGRVKCGNGAIDVQLGSTSKTCLITKKKKNSVARLRSKRKTLYSLPDNWKVSSPKTGSVKGKETYKRKCSCFSRWPLQPSTRRFELTSASKRKKKQQQTLRSLRCNSEVCKTQIECRCLPNRNETSFEDNNNEMIYLPERILNYYLSSRTRRFQRTNGRHTHFQRVPS